jgi:hypothetical protein
MEAILVALNDSHLVRHSEIRRLVTAWQDSNRNVERMLRSVPELKRYLYNEDGLPSWRAWPIAVGSGLRVSLLPGGPTGGFTTGDDLIRDEARLMFLQLLINPLREKLSEHPCARCGKYFLRETNRDRVYCSRKCGKDGTAAFATKKRLKDEHDKKVSVAKELAQKWATARTKDDWKQWVSKQPAGVREGITPKFLTRAVNHSGFVPPTKGR